MAGVLIPIVNTEVVFSCLMISAPTFEISDERREVQMVQNIARIAKAALHNLPGKSILNVSPPDLSVLSVLWVLVVLSVLMTMMTMVS